MRESIRHPTLCMKGDKVMKEAVRSTIIAALVFMAIAPLAFGATTLSPEQIRTLTEEATIWGFPVVENYKLLSFAFGANEFNTFYHTTKLKSAKDREVVTPNNDTLYSAATLDLAAEPMVLHVPDMGDRYYTFQLVDMLTNNFGYVGTRATGNKDGWYAITGPGWKGKLPPKIRKAISCRSRFVLVLGRTAVSGEADLPNVVKVENQYELMPLSKLGGTPAPAPPATDLLPYKPEKAQTLDFFGYLNWLIQYHNFRSGDQALLRKFAHIGIIPGKAFDPAVLDEPTRKAMEEGLAAGLNKIKERSRALGRNVNGWDLAPIGVPYFGDDYLFRAAYAYKAIYVNSPEEAYYPIANYDGNGQPLDGAKYRYILRLTKENLPPAKYFWSITMYDAKDRMLVENPINRYSIGDRTSGLKYDGDGSLTIHLQHGSPGPDKKNNWLPAPNEPFYVVLRIYGPSEKVLNGQWMPPPLERVK